MSLCRSFSSPPSGLAHVPIATHGLPVGCTLSPPRGLGRDAFHFRTQSKHRTNSLRAGQDVKLAFRNCACFYGHRKRGAWARLEKRKRPRGTRPSGTFSTPEVSLERLIRRVGWPGSG